MTVEEAKAALIAAQTAEREERLKALKEKESLAAQKVAAETAVWAAEENQKLSTMVGRTVETVFFNPSGEGTIIITFTDDSAFELSASGDDMTHITFDLQG